MIHANFAGTPKRSRLLTGRETPRFVSMVHANCAGTPKRPRLLTGRETKSSVKPMIPPLFPRDQHRLVGTASPLSATHVSRKTRQASCSRYTKPLTLPEWLDCVRTFVASSDHPRKQQHSTDPLGALLNYNVCWFSVVQVLPHIENEVFPFNQRTWNWV